MTHIKRICDLCGSDRTLRGEGIDVIRDCHGNAIGLFGSCCAGEVRRMVGKLANKFGGHADAAGHFLASPRGTPNIRDFDHLRTESGNGLGALRPNL